MTALVLALAGTDHHPFDRLVSWIDSAAAARPDVHFVIQYGASRAPLVAEGHAFLGHEELADLIDAAAVVVCHGGPGTITDAREAGHVPLCVPRDPALGEHVDGHQQRFAAMVGGVGVVHEVRTVEDFRRELAATLLETHTGHLAPETCRARDAARALAGVELDDAMTAVRRHLPGRQRRAHS